ncbi:thyroid transcription factor 1-associated protein 26 [Aricia agestis]|uniref:thyroid transcription factor 1-associated protein 26 n=1 Tax=Aricia agestis TaxID=91739 RepID=UPI001C2019A6|nr:thyroid transcription factor 1-associated protein 26 [Aricia agestis]
MDGRRDSFFQKKKQKNVNGKSADDSNISKKKQREKDFDKNRDIKEKNKNDKKPFDKKTYRLKKYSKKYKLEQWEEQRKKRLLQEYQKTLKNDPMAGKYNLKPFDEEVDATTQAGQFVRHPDLIAQNDQEFKKKDPFSKAKEKFDQVKQQKQEKKEQVERAKAEQQQKLQEYKKKKHDRFKKLSKKNKKGQPVMTGRLELMLEKIQKG